MRHIFFAFLFFMYLGSRFFLFFLWLLHWLPLSVQAAVGNAAGKLGYRFAKSRRHIARRNIELCFPELDAQAQEKIVREHFQWVARSTLEHGLLFYASAKRLRRIMHVEGNMQYADEHPDERVMWLVPHFVGLDIAAIAGQLYQNRVATTIYQAQSNPVMEKAMRNSRMRFGKAVVFTRQQGLVPVTKAIRRDGFTFFNLPDQDFGMQDAEFVPFFGIPAATLTAPSRMAKALRMKIVPITTEMLPGGKGYKIKVHPPLENLPTADAYADTVKINAFIEQEIRQCPSQYLWVHRRFKTRPPGEPSLYQ